MENIYNNDDDNVYGDWIYDGDKHDNNDAD